jgi:translation initiation factor 2B subunit (eIF-2B alpha/beta/delta family)
MIYDVQMLETDVAMTGKHLLASLRSASIPTTYVLLSSLSLILPRVSLCLLGTHALLSNGSMFSRAGTAMVAMMSKERGVPVACCCETYKFSERVMLDSIVGNEMGESSPRPPLCVADHFRQDHHCNSSQASRPHQRTSPHCLSSTTSLAQKMSRSSSLKRV